MRLPRFLAALLLVFTLSSCSVDQVLAVASHHGISLTSHQATSISAHYSVLDTPAEIEAYIRAKWAGTGQADRAVRVARCESGLNANPPHNNPHYGVFQMGVREFRTFHLPGEENIFNAKHNINAAYAYWDYGARGVGVGSWRPWACRG